MCFPKTNTDVNSCRCLKDESCSLVYSPGKLLALFFAETWPDCKEFVVQNGLNIHNVSSTSLFRIHLTLADLNPNQVSSQFVQQLRMICMKLSISSENDPKDAMRVHELDSTQTKLFWPERKFHQEREHSNALSLSIPLGSTVLPSKTSQRLCSGTSHLVQMARLLFCSPSSGSCREAVFVQVSWNEKWGQQRPRVSLYGH